MMLLNSDVDDLTCWETGPSGWEPTSMGKETGPDGSGRNPTKFDENRK